MVTFRFSGVLVWFWELVFVALVCLFLPERWVDLWFYGFAWVLCLLRVLVLVLVIRFEVDLIVGRLVHGLLGLWVGFLCVWLKTCGTLGFIGMVCVVGVGSLFRDGMV